MRQAGRYLPEYREIRSKVAFLDFCKNPQLAAEVMIRTVERLGVDAAIIFSDLLPILEPMGLDLEFQQGEGPVIHNPVREPADEDLHELMAERYESAATIVTSNLDLTEWDQAFPANKLLASATLDRLRHNAYCLVLDGKSYRAPRQLPAVIRSRLANEAKTAQA